MAATTAAVSAYPERTIRIVSGWVLNTSLRNSTPFIPGIRKSEITTCTCGDVFRSSSPSSPEAAVSIS